MGRKGFFSYREDILHEKEGPVTATAWRGSLLAWANDKGIKVLDVDADERISFVERPEIEGKCKQKGPPHYPTRLMAAQPSLTSVIPWLDALSLFSPFTLC